MIFFRPYGCRWSLLVLTLLFSFLEPILAQENLSAAEFVSTTLNRHPSMLRANEAVSAAEFGLKAAGFQPNPTLTLALTAGDAGESSNALSQGFEISGQPRIRSEIAQAQLEAITLQREAVRRQVIADAYRVWLSLWKFQAKLEIAQLQGILVKEMSRVARRRFEVGEISENESLRVELAAAQAEVNMVMAEKDLAASRGQAQLLLGSERAAGTLSTSPGPPASLIQGLTLEEVLSSLEKHPAIESQRREARAIFLGANLIKKERAPALNLSVYRSSLIRSSALEQGVQLSLSWQIFDWGSIRHRQQQQEAKVKVQEAAIEELLLANRQELTVAWTNLEAARQKKLILEKQAERYAELTAEARTAYDYGLLSLTDVLQTESSFRQAGTELVEAKAEILNFELQILERTALAWPQDFLKEDI